MWLLCGKESITKLDKDMWSASWAEDAIEEEELCDRLFDYFSDENSLWCAGLLHHRAVVQRAGLAAGEVPWRRAAKRPWGIGSSSSA